MGETRERGREGGREGGGGGGGGGGRKTYGRLTGETEH